VVGTVPMHYFYVDQDQALHFDADPNPNFHCDADPDPAHILQIKAHVIQHFLIVSLSVYLGW